VSSGKSLGFSRRPITRVPVRRVQPKSVVGPSSSIAIRQYRFTCVKAATIVSDAALSQADDPRSGDGDGLGQIDGLAKGKASAGCAGTCPSPPASNRHSR